jgi:hypothetical protein
VHCSARRAWRDSLRGGAYGDAWGNTNEFRSYTDPTARAEWDLGANPRTVVAQHGATAAQHPECRGVVVGGLGHDAAASSTRRLGEQ